MLIRTGNVPAEWYKLHDHQGYSVKGQKVIKPKEQDELEKFVERQGNKDWWKKIHDFANNKDVTLTKGDLELLQRLRKGQFADTEIDPFEVFEFADDHNKDIFQHPFGDPQEPKRRFVPSKWERLKVSKFIHALKKGWMKTLAEKKLEEEQKEKENERIWDVWEDDTIVAWRPRKMPKPITAPKRELPTHAESVNPAEEYLFDEQEKE